LPWHYNKQEVSKKPMIGSSACPHFQVQLLLQNSKVQKKKRKILLQQTLS
jgi:hypothetical protein